MTKIKQSIYGKKDGPISTFNVFVENRSPSWKANGTGTASFEARYHDEAGYLSLFLGEYSDKSRKQTMLDLDERSARAFYQFLKVRFG